MRQKEKNQKNPAETAMNKNKAEKLFLQTPFVKSAAGG